MMRKQAREYPKSVCLETCSLCNGRCVFCPYPDVHPDRPVVMETELVHKLIDEIAAMPVERFSLFNNNEPLLDPRIQDLISYARQKMPGVRQTLSSNGKILTAEVLVTSIRNGIDRFFVSIPTLDPEAYRMIMGGDVQKVVDTVLSIPEAYYPNIRIAVPRTRFFDDAQFHRVFGSRGIRCIPWEMEASRGWTQLEDIRRISRLQCCIGCDRPMDQAIISSNGDVLICCRDWHHECVLGNIRESSLEEIWNGEKMKEVQKAMAEGRFNDIPLCSKCSRVTEIST